jgi:hypothetical protein
VTRKWLVVLATFLLPLGLIGSEAADAANRGTIDLRELQVWERGNEQPSAVLLSATQYSCARHVVRILFRGPAGERVVLEFEYRPAAGLTRARITDDETGWWAELVDRSGLKVEVSSPDKYGAILFWQQKRFFEGPFPLERSLVINGRTVMARPSTTHDWEFASSFYEALEHLGAAKGIVVETPAAVAKALLFARSAYEDGMGHGTVLGGFSQLVGVLAPAVAAHGDPSWRQLYAGARWAVTESSGFPETIAETSAELSLLGEFKSAPGNRHLLEGLEAPPDGGCGQAGR